MRPDYVSIDNEISKAMMGKECMAVELRNTLLREYTSTNDPRAHLDKGHATCA